MKQRRILFVNYFTRHFGTHNFYAWKFFFCEVLNLINILSQVRPCLTTSTLAWCIHYVANQAVIQGLSYIVDQIKWSLICGSRSPWWMCSWVVSSRPTAWRSWPSPRSHLKRERTPCQKSSPRWPFIFKPLTSILLIYWYGCQTIKRNLFFPKGYQVHILQVWSHRYRWKQGRSLHSCSKHPEREDLHLPMVLVSPFNLSNPIWYTM